jgi:hypothetical protein
MSMLDGNGVAGLLAEVFGSDVSGEPRGCGSCGADAAVGAHRAFLGAGVVLRCPACGDIALVVVQTGERNIVELRGRWRLDLPA